MSKNGSLTPQGECVSYSVYDINAKKFDMTVVYFDQCILGYYGLERWSNSITNSVKHQNFFFILWNFIKKEKMFLALEILITNTG